MIFCAGKKAGSPLYASNARQQGTSKTGFSRISFSALRAASDDTGVAGSWKELGDWEDLVELRWSGGSLEGLGELGGMGKTSMVWGLGRSGMDWEGLGGIQSIWWGRTGNVGLFQQEEA